MSDENEVYEVEEILDSMEKKERTYYLVKWRGYTDEENTWEPEDNLVFAKTAIQNYQQKLKQQERERNANIERYNKRKETEKPQNLSPLKFSPRRKSGNNSDDEYKEPAYTDTGDKIPRYVRSKNPSVQTEYEKLITQQKTQNIVQQKTLDASKELSVQNHSQITVIDLIDTSDEEDSQVDTPKTTPQNKTESAFEKDLRMLVDNPPILIYSCTKLFGIIRYYVHSEKKNYDVCSDAIKTYNPKLVLNFLQNKIVFY